MGGICDVTSLLASKEMVQDQVNVDILIGQYWQNSPSRVPCSLHLHHHHPVLYQKWNDLIKIHGKKLFQFEYPRMQASHNQLIKHINKKITQLNEAYSVPTPFLHSWVQHMDRGETLYRFQNLYDGVHPVPNLQVKWAGELHKADARLWPGPAFPVSAARRVGSTCCGWCSTPGCGIPQGVSSTQQGRCCASW